MLRNENVLPDSSITPPCKLHHLLHKLAAHCHLICSNCLAPLYKFDSKNLRCTLRGKILVGNIHKFSLTPRQIDIIAA